MATITSAGARITVVNIEPEIMTDRSGDKWLVECFTCENGNYWSAEGRKIKVNGDVSNTFSRSISLPIPKEVKKAAEPSYVKNQENA